MEPGSLFTYGGKIQGMAGGGGKVYLLLPLQFVQRWPVGGISLRLSGLCMSLIMCRSSRTSRTPTTTAQPVKPRGLQMSPRSKSYLIFCCDAQRHPRHNGLAFRDGRSPSSKCKCRSACRYLQWYSVRVGMFFVFLRIVIAWVLCAEYFRECL